MLGRFLREVPEFIRSKMQCTTDHDTTAWDYDYTNGYSGIGPDIIVAGYGNGSLRVFDTRSNSGDPAQVLNVGSASRRK
jgi:hypothetical protein